jgi:hypothetical protein
MNHGRLVAPQRCLRHAPANGCGKSRRRSGARHPCLPSAAMLCAHRAAVGGLHLNPSARLSNSHRHFAAPAFSSSVGPPCITEKW